MSWARSSADPVASSAGGGLVAGSADVDPMAGSALASVGLGVGVWLAASSTCVGEGGLMCPPPAPPFVAFCHRPMAVASMAKHKCAATLYGVSPALNRTHF